jgi:outer membrane protein OmpA-like peptidoglycan-associated protein
MSKRESSVGLVLMLLVTFGLSAAGLWWAHQYSFGTHLIVENQQERQVNTSKTIPPKPKNTPISANVVTSISPKSTIKPEIQNKPSPTVKQTSVKVKAKTKTAADLKKSPVREQIKFTLDSPHITEDGHIALEQLANKIKSYDGEGVSIRINAPAGESDFSQSIAQQRGEEIAGYLRDRGLTHKIIISKKGAIESINQTRNQPIEISLFKN